MSMLGSRLTGQRRRCDGGIARFYDRTRLDCTRQLLKVKKKVEIVTSDLIWRGSIVAEDALSWDGQARHTHSYLIRVRKLEPQKFG